MNVDKSKWTTGLSDQEAHDQLLKFSLGGVNPPTKEEAAAGTWKDVPDEPVDPALARAGKGLLRGAVFGKLDEGGLGADPKAGEDNTYDELGNHVPKESAEPEPADQPFTVNNEVGKLLTTAAPEIDTSKPLGFSPPPVPRPGRGPMVDTELKAAQEQAEKNKATDRLGQAVTRFTERPDAFLNYAVGLGRGGQTPAPAHNSMWDEEEKDESQPVKDLMTRRASEAAMKKKQDAEDLQARLDDPESAESKFAVSLIEKNAPGLDVKGKSAAEISRFAPFVLKTIQENGELVKANAVAKARADEDQAKRDAKEAATAAAAEKKKEEQDTNSSNWRSQMETRYPKEIAALPPGVWASTDMKVGQDLQNGWERDRAEAQRVAHRPVKAPKEDKEKAKKEAAEKKAADAETLLDRKNHVPGYTWDGYTIATPPEVKAVRDAHGQIGSIIEGMNEMQALLKEHGTETWPTEAKAKMQSLHVALALQLKNKAGFDLGVISGHDMDFLNQALGDPNSDTFMNKWNPFEAGNLIKRIDEVKGSLKTKMRLAAEAIGQKEGERPDVEMVDRDGDRHMVPYYNVQKALNDPDPAHRMTLPGAGPKVTKTAGGR